MAFDIDRGIEPDDALALLEDLLHGAGDSADRGRSARAHFLAGADEAFPGGGVGGLEFDDLDLPVVGEEARADDAGIVEDQQVVLFDEVREVGEACVIDLAGVAVDDEHAASVAPLGRAGGDEFLGEEVVEIVGAECLHRAVGLWRARVAIADRRHILTTL